MAKQTGIFKIIGTIGDITFYEMDGEFYARKKSSLDGKRVKKDPKFKRTMEEAIEFGKASAATRAVYWALPEEMRVHGFYGILTGRMRKLMRAGKTANEAQLQLLHELCAEAGAIGQQDAPGKSQADGFADHLLSEVFAVGSNTQPDVSSPKKNFVAVPQKIAQEILFADGGDFPVWTNRGFCSGKVPLKFYVGGSLSDLRQEELLSALR
jgi:hypothetical protein